ncbi:hypothetical protein WC27P1_00007 [Weissella phage WC27P1]|nr:hypothetical protein WC27P1_00007 [Weissella phage WC27P1]WAX18127.1 hypothetical protein WC29P1_00031 [Weissella phage WC29P1]WAX18149.1 hypothetical protein WC29P2_00011 [Weissella phage WC29P2]
MVVYDKNSEGYKWHKVIYDEARFTKMKLKTVIHEDLKIIVVGNSPLLSIDKLIGFTVDGYELDTTKLYGVNFNYERERKVLIDEALAFLPESIAMNKESRIKKQLFDMMIGDNTTYTGNVERHYHLDVFSQKGTLLRSANYPTKEQANKVAKVAMEYGWLVKGKII